MSRSYMIRLPLNILIAPGFRQKLGNFTLSFELMEILPLTQMQQILRDILIARGFVETEKGLAMPCEDDKSAVFDPVTMTMHLRVPVPESMAVSVIDDRPPEWVHRIEEAIGSDQLLSPSLTLLAQQTLGQQAAHQLQQLALEAKSLINSALKETYREAIKEKAGKLGSVSNISETSDGAIYRIRIEISG